LDYLAPGETDRTEEWVDALAAATAEAIPNQQCPFYFTAEHAEGTEHVEFFFSLDKPFFQFEEPFLIVSAPLAVRKKGDI